MSIETYQFNLPITPGSIPPVLHLSQYDSGRTFTAVLRDDANVPFELDASATAVIKGRNAAGIAWQQDCTVSGANVTFTPSGAATDQFGVMPVTIEITESDEIMSPLLMVWNIQRAGYTNEEAVLSPEFQTAIEAAVAQALATVGILLAENQAEKTPTMTESVGVDEYGKLWVSPGGAGSVTPEAIVSATGDMTAQQAADTRGNIGAGTYSKPANGITIYDLAYDVQTSISKADNAVLVTQQTLSDAQKSQARDNIGAISASDIGTVFTLKGSVATVAGLPATGNTVGDVYYVEAVSAGYIWMTSTTYPNGYWEELGETIDLSAYEEKPTVVQVSGNTPTIALAEDNTIYELTGEAITSITITARENGAAFAVIFNTPAGSTPPTFTYPTVNMYMPDDFALDVFRHYEINVDSKGFAAVGSWSYD